MLNQHIGFFSIGQSLVSFLSSQVIKADETGAVDGQMTEVLDPLKIEWNHHLAGLPGL